MAGGAIDLDEITTPEVLDPRQVRGAITAALFLNSSMRARGRALVNGWSIVRLGDEGRAMLWLGCGSTG